MQSLRRRTLARFPVLERMDPRNPEVRARLGFEETIRTRKVADQETRRLVARLDPRRLSVLEIPGQSWRDFGFRSYRSAEFPDFDLSVNRSPERFDLIIAEHVFGHLRWPYRAAKNVLQMLAPLGHFLIVTPFLYKVHPNPLDCVRWTEQVLADFLEDAGFAAGQTTSGSWGNRRCIEATFRVEYRLFNRFLHPIDTEPDHPIVV